MHVLKFIFICLEVLVLFNLLIFVHELGHFLVARWRGLKVERFAIWFGKPIWKMKIGDIEYCLGWIPAGGYVSLPQMASMETIEGKTESTQETLPPISAWDKILVAFAGPLFSFLLAMVFAVVIWQVGRPMSESETTTTIGYVMKNGPADKAGIMPGDHILEVDNKPVTKFMGMGSSVTWRIVRSEGSNVPVKVERDGKILTFNPVPVKEPTKAFQRSSLRKIQISPRERAVIYEIATNSPADLAGLRAGDEIVGLNGSPIYSWMALSDESAQQTNKPMDLTVQREGKKFNVQLTPVFPISPTNAKPDIGILAYAGRTDIKLVYPGPWTQITDSVNAMVATFDALFSRKSDIKAHHLGGAVKIFSVYYMLFDSEQGWRLALWFSVVLNVNLALLNLLPFPVLDGGHIVLSFLEAIFKRAINPKFLGVLQNAFAVLLIGYMLYITFYDVQELPWSKSKEPATIQFAPPAKSGK